jgi:serine/threonine protein kinase
MDLKPSNNILLRRNTDPEGLGSIRLTDFGSAIADDGDRKESFAKRNTRRAQGRINLHSFSSGTTAYWPPETIIFKDHSKATDMWALGCIIYILVTGKHPFDFPFFSFPFLSPFLCGLSIFSFLLFDPMKQQQNYFDFNSCLHWSLSSFFFPFPFPFFSFPSPN